MVGKQKSNVVDVVPIITQRRKHDQKIVDTLCFYIAAYRGRPCKKTAHTWAKDILTAVSLQQPPKNKHNFTEASLLSAAFNKLNRGYNPLA